MHLKLGANLILGPICIYGYHFYFYFFVFLSLFIFFLFSLLRVGGWESHPSKLVNPLIYEPQKFIYLFVHVFVSQPNDEEKYAESPVVYC